MESILQWSIWERTFTAARAPTGSELASAEPLHQVDFRHSASGTVLTLAGYWDGGTTWRVRFAPPLAGDWAWSSRSADAALDGQAGTLAVRAATADEVLANRNLHGHVRVTEDGRRFAYADGTPLLLVADTNWAMNTARCGLGDGDGPFTVWLRDRVEAGFTAVMTEFYEIDQPNEGGSAFLGNTEWPGNGRYQELNPAFFAALDRRMQSLWDAGMIVCAHPTWVGKQVAMSPRDAIWTSRYLMARYGAFNLIWSLSGEYQYAYTQVPEPWTRSDWVTLGNAVAEANVYHHPLSVHPSARQDLDDPAEWPEAAHQASSGGEFHEEPWLDHNWLQTGHAADTLGRVPQRVAENTARVPTKPVLLSEGYYETQTVEGASARMVRWQAWSSLLDGAAGTVYGANGVWQFFDRQAAIGIGKDRANSQPWHGQTWREALAALGGRQLAHLIRFMRAIDGHRLEPRREWLRVRGLPAQVPSVTDPHCAAIGDQVVVVYVPAGNSGLQLEVLHLGTHDYRAQWFDPRTGAYSPASDQPIRGEGQEGAWRAPSVYRHNDWVLLLTSVE